MIHEGPLTWRTSKDKTLGGCPSPAPWTARLGPGRAPAAPPREGAQDPVPVLGGGGGGTPHGACPPDLHVLLLDDLLVLLQKQDEKLLLKCHSKTAAGSSDSKQTFSPVLKLNAVLVRSVATGAARAWPRASLLAPEREDVARGGVGGRGPADRGGSVRSPVCAGRGPGPALSTRGLGRCPPASGSRGRRRA